MDLQTGVWGGGKAVCRQEVPLIYIFLFHRHINYVLILNFVKRSTSFVVHIRPWTQEHIQAFVSTFVYSFLFFLSTSTCMSMKHLSWVYCEHLPSELSCDEKKNELFFHLHQSVALKMIYWNQFSILTAIINTPTAVTVSVYRLWHSFNNDHVGEQHNVRHCSHFAEYFEGNILTLTVVTCFHLIGSSFVLELSILASHLWPGGDCQTCI